MAFSIFKRKNKSKGHKDHYHNLLVKDVINETDEAITNFKKRIDNVIHYLGEEGFFDAEKLIKIGISHKIR